MLDTKEKKNKELTTKFYSKYEFFASPFVFFPSLLQLHLLYIAFKYMISKILIYTI